MKKTLLKFGIAALTFSLGLGVFYLLYLQSEIKDERNSLIAVAEAVNTHKKDSTDDFDPWKMPDDFPPLEKGEFYPVGHACGNGYVDGWLAYDGSRLSEGFDTISRKGFDEEVASAGKVIERIENHPNKDGKKGLRIVLQGRNEETGKDYFSILWFGKWHKNDYGRYFLDAPNLEIALELERKLIKDSQRMN